MTKVQKSHFIDAEINKIEKGIKLLAYLKPVNLVTERTLFFAGKKRNPVFRYNLLRYDPLLLGDRLKKLHPDQSILGILLQKKIQELEKKLDLLAYRGTNQFSLASEALYGAPNAFLEEEANRILKLSPKKKIKRKTFDTKAVQIILQKTLDDYGLHHWHVHIREHLISDIAAGKRHALHLRQGIHFTEQRIERIVAHEIETHILTAENGKYQPYELFHRGFANYLETQEGMAIFAQECQKSCFPLETRRLCYLTLAVIEAYRGSFRQVYEKMRSLGLTKASAFRMTLRAKRGLNDTSEKGAFTKDLIYLKGFRRIEAFVKNGGDLKKLYVGKVALEDLPFINQISGIVPPRHLPSWIL